MIRYNPKGLTTPQIDESRRRHGDNVITPPKDDSAWRLLLEKFRDPIIRILLLAAVLSLIIGFVHKDFTESVGIICAIILATCVGFWFEWDAQRRFRRLNQVNDDIPVKVMREGSIREIPRRDVVTGDVVYIESGETIPADGELVEAVSLKINESTLTGEPEVDKTVNEADFDPEATYPSNAVLRGTTVADGYGVMVVTAVGDATEAGRVTEQSTVQSEEQTPLDRQLTRLSRLIGRLGILLSALIFCVMLGKAIFAGGLLESDWLTISQHVLQIFMVSVAIIVMAVPEGLPMSITLSLAMSMRRMLKTNNLVRKMHACETMGAVTVICTDKTGTLTQNRMHVQELIRYDTLPAREFAEVVALNTTAFLDAEGHIIGNPTEGALLEWMRAGGEDYEPLRAEAKIVNRLTFSTERKYMATIIESGISGRRILCVKGAPEIVRTMCAPDGKDAQVAEQLLGFQSRAMRTLAVAWAETASDDCLEAVKAGGLHFAAVFALLGRGGFFQMVLHSIDVFRSDAAGSALRRNVQLTQRLQKILGRYAKFCRKVFHLGLVFSHALISLTLPPACAEPPEFFPAGRFRAYIPAASGLGLALIDQKFPPLRGQNMAHELLFGHAPPADGAHPGGHMPPVHASLLPRPSRPCPRRLRRRREPIRPRRG